MFTEKETINIPVKLILSYSIMNLGMPISFLFWNNIIEYPGNLIIDVLAIVGIIVISNTL